MSWAKLSTIFEPENLMRRVYGFDSFSGFPTIDAKDANIVAMPQKGELASNSKDELEELVAEYDKDRFLGHLDKCHLIAGNACETIPQFVQLPLAARFVVCALLISPPSYLGAWLLYRWIELPGIAWGKRVLARAPRAEPPPAQIKAPR